MNDQPQQSNAVFADFVDGEHAAVQRVQVSLVYQNGEMLRIQRADNKPAIDWNLADIRSIPDQAGQTAVVLGLDGDFPARVIVTDAVLARQLDLACPDLRRRHKAPDVMRRLAILTAAAIASVAVIIFVLIPIMANQLATLLPVNGERALGDSTFEQIKAALGENEQFGLQSCERADGLASLDKMMARLSPGADIPYDIRMHVLNHDMVNAFALPGGHIVLFKGLLTDVRSAEELAGILAHEMAHVENRDPTRLALRSAGSVGVLGLLLGDFAGGAAVLYLTESLIQAQYSRGAEAAADVYAHALLGEAGVPSTPMADFFLRILEEQGDAEGLVSHLSSHPEARARADAAIAADRVGRQYDPVLSQREWQDLRYICG